MSSISKTTDNQTPNPTPIQILGSPPQADIVPYKDCPPYDPSTGQYIEVIKTGTSQPFSNSYSKFSKTEIPPGSIATAG